VSIFPLHDVNDQPAIQIRHSGVKLDRPSPRSNPREQRRFTRGRLIIQIPFHLKILSYLQPVLLKRSESPVGGFLDLILYHNRFQLLAADAFYSDGDRYFPAVAMEKHLRDFLPAAKSVLVLGAGLGSIVQVMRARGYAQHYTLVERDKTVLGWALDILGDGNEQMLNPVCQDAESFMAENQHKYDLVFVDIFNGRTVPDFVTAPLFLRRCRDSLSPGGRLALNYIEVHKCKWEKAQKVIANVFPGCRLVSRNDNRILISPPSTNA
jgi:hypothetical protein